MQKETEKVIEKVKKCARDVYGQLDFVQSI